MVGVTVGVNHGDHRPIAAVSAIQGQRGSGRLGGDQRVDDDDPGIALDEADVGKVETANLVDALDHLVEPLLSAQLALPPQAGVHRRRRLPVHERVNVVVPHHSSIGRLDDARFERTDESPVGAVEVDLVGEGQSLQVLAVGGFDGHGRRLLVHVVDIATRTRPPVVDCANGCAPSSDRT